MHPQQEHLAYLLTRKGLPKTCITAGQGTQPFNFPALQHADGRVMLHDTHVTSPKELTMPRRSQEYFPPGMKDCRQVLGLSTPQDTPRAHQPPGSCPYLHGNLQINLATQGQLSFMLFWAGCACSSAELCIWAGPWQKEEGNACG